MHLCAHCERCGATVDLGQIHNLPQPSLLMSMLADILHDHSCPSEKSP